MRALLAMLAVLAVAATATAAASPRELTLATPLPAWLAPGAPLTVGGTTGATSVELLSDGVRVGSATTGADGTFSVRARAPPPTR